MTRTLSRTVLGLTRREIGLWALASTATFTGAYIGLMFL